MRYWTFTLGYQMVAVAPTDIDLVLRALSLIHRVKNVYPHPLELDEDSPPLVVALNLEEIPHPESEPPTELVPF